jgi:hypothetical protein
MTNPALQEFSPLPKASSPVLVPRPLIPIVRWSRLWYHLHPSSRAALDVRVVAFRMLAVVPVIGLRRGRLGIHRRLLLDDHRRGRRVGAWIIGVRIPWVPTIPRPPRPQRYRAAEKELRVGMPPCVPGQGTYEKHRHYCKKRTNYLLHVASPLAYATQALKSRSKTFDVPIKKKFTKRT